MAIQQTVLDQYKALDWENLLRRDLGDAGKLDEVKPNLDRIKNVYEKVLQYQTTLAEVPNYERNIENSITNFINGCNSQILDASYTNITEKPAKVAYIRQQEESIIGQLGAVFSYLQFVDPTNTTKQNELQKRINEVDVLTKKVEKSLETSNKVAQKQEVIEYGNYFGDMADNTNAIRARNNNIYIYITLGVTALLACVFVWDKQFAFVPDQQMSVFKSIWNGLMTQSVLLKIFIISAGGYLVAHFSRNYSAEMNMYYLNKHRQNALNSHNRILESISKTEKSENAIETHNAILIQITKTIFDVQDTGYLKNASNPVPSAQIIETVRSGVSRN
jgi:hypothetical protein